MFPLILDYNHDHVKSQIKYEINQVLGSLSVGALEELLSFLKQLEENSRRTVVSSDVL